MFTCCLCGKQYENEAAAVKCVNQCGREAQQSGKFVTKESKYKGSFSSVQFSQESQVQDFSLKEELLKIFNELSLTMPLQEVNRLRIRTFKNWDSLSSSEKKNQFERVLMISKLFK